MFFTYIIFLLCLTKINIPIERETTAIVIQTETIIILCFLVKELAFDFVVALMVIIVAFPSSSVILIWATPSDLTVIFPFASISTILGLIDSYVTLMFSPFVSCIVIVGESPTFKSKVLLIICSLSAVITIVGETGGVSLS